MLNTGTLRKIITSALETMLAVIAKDSTASTAFTASDHRTMATKVDTLAFAILALRIGTASEERSTAEGVRSMATARLVAVREDFTAHTRGTKTGSLWEDAGRVRLALWCT